MNRPTVDLVKVCIKLAADASRSGKAHSHARTLVKRDLIDDLRDELDRAGFGADWRTLHRMTRIEEREGASA